MASKADAAKKGHAEGETWAASRDTATLDRPDSGRNQRASQGSPHNAPFDVAYREVLTPSAVSFVRDDVPGDVAVTGMPVTRERRDGTVVVDAECPEGHEDGEVVAGTLGKTATCSKCGALYRAKAYVEDGTNAEITVEKNGRVSLSLPKATREAARDEGRGAGPAYMAATREETFAEDKKAEARRKGGTRRKSTRKSKIAKATEAKSE